MCTKNQNNFLNTIDHEVAISIGKAYYDNCPSGKDIQSYCEYYHILALCGSHNFYYQKFLYSLLCDQCWLHSQAKQVDIIVSKNQLKYYTLYNHYL